MINETMYARGAESSKIREIFSYAQERKAQIGEDKVFDFSLGNPSVPAPEAVRKSIERSLAELTPEQLHGYTPAPGLPATRAAVADSLNRRFGTAYAAGNVFMTVGAAASVSCTLHAVVNPGDEVIVIGAVLPGVQGVDRERGRDLRGGSGQRHDVSAERGQRDERYHAQDGRHHHRLA